MPYLPCQNSLSFHSSSLINKILSTSSNHFRIILQSYKKSRDNSPTPGDIPEDALEPNQIKKKL